MAYHEQLTCSNHFLSFNIIHAVTIGRPTALGMTLVWEGQEMHCLAFFV